uniref:ORF60h n=1 Tax=Pinus koraiensis TaxID=88728 RepID=A4QMF7_PINKO|nr:ORF60h [Pinus koraiensis]ABP35494.1 ORF60h [Pinus koraiensis]
MPLITNEWQVLFLGLILSQWELDKSIHPHVLLLLLHWELLYVLLGVEQIVDFSPSFVEYF